MHPKRLANPSARCPKCGHKATEIALRKAWDQGWWIERGKKNHIKCYSPDGKGIVIAASTPSDHRAVSNLYRELRKYGFQP